MKIFNWLEEKSFRISRGYWNALLLISGVAVVGAIGLLIWSITPVFTESVKKEEYPGAPSVSRAEIENALTDDAPISETRETPIQDVAAGEPTEEPEYEGDKSAYLEALGRLRETLGEVYWAENSKSALTLYLAEVDIESYDRLTVYAGTNINGTPLGNITNSSQGATVTSSDPSGAFTFKFKSDGTVSKGGWTIEVSNAGTSASQNEVVNMRSRGSLTTDRCTLTDSGGQRGDYRQNENWSMTVRPKSPGEAPGELVAFLNNECSDYDCKTEWVRTFTGALIALDWSGIERGLAMEVFLEGDGWSPEKGLCAEWAGLLGSMPSDEAIGNIERLAAKFLPLSTDQRDALTAQLTKSSIEKPGMLVVMSGAITNSPFVGDLEGFNVQTSRFFDVMQGWRGSHTEAYASMLEIYKDKSAFRIAEIQRINEDFMDAEALAEAKAKRQQSEKEEMRLKSLMGAGAGISAIALVALLLVLLSIRRLLVQLNEKD